MTEYLVGNKNSSIIDDTAFLSLLATMLINTMVTESLNLSDGQIPHEIGDHLIHK